MYEYCYLQVATGYFKCEKIIFDQILLGPLFDQFAWGWLKMARTRLRHIPVNHNFFALVHKQKFGLVFFFFWRIYFDLSTFTFLS